MPNMIPGTYVQILLHSGFVHDISVEQWDMLKTEIMNGNEWLSCEDIYGGECWMPSKNIITTRVCTPEARKLYNDYHKDEEHTI